jgi:glycosyltransferase involved in cell wall biosynthesis
MSLRVGFHYHIPVYQDPIGELRTPGYFGRFLDGVASRCESLVCFLYYPRTDEIHIMDYVLQAPNITWVNIGLHPHLPRRFVQCYKMTRPLKDWRGELDTLLIRGPSPLLPAMARAAGNLPIALLLVGDYVAGVDDLPFPRWRKEIVRVLAKRNASLQLQVAQRALTFVNSEKLYRDLRTRVPNLELTQTTTLSQSDFFSRDDTCSDPRVRLLYTGRMVRGKGLLTLVEALSQVVEQGKDVVLDLVGWENKSDNTLEEAHHLAAMRGISERVVYHGYRSVGPELFSYYRQADIYVIASQGSFEGFPRTIWEAMAHSLPVIATRVGSIPILLRDRESAILVEPGDSVQLALAIDQIITDQALRTRLIKSGKVLARGNTIEKRSEELVRRLEQWAGGSHDR